MENGVRQNGTGHMPGAAGLRAGRDRLCRICPRKRTPAIPGSAMQDSGIFHLTAKDSADDHRGQQYI
jgi:hypothetical protein